MKKWMKKTVAVFLTVAVTITMCVPTFASEIGNTASLMSLSSKEKALCENVLTSLKTDIPNESRIEYYKDILALENKGFTTNEMVVLDTDIRQVAQLIEDLDMNSNEIENLKNGFLTSRPTDPEILLENSHFLSYDEVGIVEPLVENTSSRATAFKEIQISLFTDPKLNKFYEQTGFVHLGNAYATSKIYNNELKYTRPYVILGGHGTTGSIDTGLVWYQEYNKWMLFMNGTCGWKLGSSFYSNGNDMTKTIGTANGSDAYLDMK